MSNDDTPWDAIIAIAPDDAARLQQGRHASPHSVLGCHEAHDSEQGVVVRVMHPDAIAAHLTLDGHQQPLTRIAEGLFATYLPHFRLPLHPEVTFRFADGNRWTLVDPYSFWPTLGDHDLHLFGEGRHFQIWNVMGARARAHEGHAGTAFAVWAPNAAAVSVVSDDNGWDGRIWPMRAMGSSGVFELFVPGVAAGARYQFEIFPHAGPPLRKSDPYAEAAEHPPARASIVTAGSEYAWGDADHMERRRHRDLGRARMNIYEVHPASFRRHPDGRAYSYRELADDLIPHMLHFGFTHLELLPICEHPFDGSWGYQVTGFFAPTARFGTPDDFRYLVDRCHQHGIDVILDWVPAHFPKDDFALARFDGTALYEHADPRQAEHPDWGTLIFNYGRHEVQNFLVGSALYWLQEFHVDGLRVDAVASMLYLDYSREHDEWVPNQQGGRENLEAIEFLRHLNAVVAERVIGAYTIAEESTSWAGVTASVQSGGLGFAFKWNMGWMHDTLVYFARDPIHRQYHQNDLTFASVYEHSERFLMPLSHDEVVHGKRSLLAKMPGDRWQQFSNLRALLTYQYTRPGKKLVFMGTEFALDGEWDHRVALPRPAQDDEARQAFMRFFAALGQLYHEQRALSAADVDPLGFRFIDTMDHAQSVLSYARCAGREQVLVVLNLTPAPRPEYRIGTPGAGRYTTVFNSDERRFGGSDFVATTEADTDDTPMHGFPQSVLLDLPPLGVLVLAYQESSALAAAHDRGIVEHFHTIDGIRHTTTETTRAALLAALGDAPATPPPASEPPSPGTEQRVYDVDAALGGKPALGIWTQLYSLHSEHTWGIGDFGELQRLVRWAADLGLDFIGLNPLHATYAGAHPAIPYHPITRLFDTPLYIDPEAVPEVRKALSAQPSRAASLSRQREDLNCGPEVHYPEVLRLKLDVLRMGYRELIADPSMTARRDRLMGFIEQGGTALERFATFCAIQAERLAAGEPAPSYDAFPEELRRADAPAVARYAAEHRDELGFHQYLQFLVDEQLAATAALARQQGMRIGLYLDLAVGAAHGGFDAWCYPSLYVPSASLGAPPDALAPQGQDWGIVPLHPEALWQDQFAHLRFLYRQAMRHAGALRIDHAMALTRQYWIPRDVDAPGTYVTFPMDPMLDVLAEESQRARCLVVAEDLGTVPDGFRAALEARGMLRYEVLHFARTQAGAFRAPRDFERDALLCLSTHDLPTFSEFWAGGDLLLRRDLGVLDEQAMLAAAQGRMRDKAALLEWLADRGETIDAHGSAARVLAAVHRQLAAADSALLCLSLDDLTLEPHSVNVPGTTADQGFVSFARRTRKTLDEMLTDPKLADAVREVVAAHRKRPQ